MGAELSRQPRSGWLGPGEKHDSVLCSYHYIEGAVILFSNGDFFFSELYTVQIKAPKTRKTEDWEKIKNIKNNQV